jgi:homoserine O-acetyltransferase
MDLYDPQRDWNGEAWQRVRAKVLLFGISSDVLFPESDVRAFAEELREAGVRCSYERVVSSHGHDSFLAEPDKLVGLLAEFLKEDDPSEDSLRTVGVEERGVGARNGDVV